MIIYNIDFKIVLFNVVHTLNEARDPMKSQTNMDHIWCVTLILLDFLSITQLQMMPDVWPKPYHVNFSLGPGLLKLIAGDNDVAMVYYIFYGIAALVTVFVSITSIYMGISFIRGVFFSYRPAIMLRYSMGVIVTALFVPLLEILIHPIECLVMPGYDHSGICDLAIPLICCSAIILLFFVPISAMTQLLYVDTHPCSRDVEASYTGKMNATDTVIRTLVTLIITCFGHLYPVQSIAIVMLLFCFLYLNLGSTLPYNNMKFNYLRCGLYSVSIWFAVTSLVLALVHVSDESEAIIAHVMVGLTPLIFLLSCYYPYRKITHLSRFIDGIVEGSIEEEEEAMVPIGVTSIDTGYAMSLFPSRSCESFPILANCKLQNSQVTTKFKGLFLTQSSIANVEKMYEAAVSAFPESAETRVAYAKFVHAVHRDETRATAMLAMVDRNKCSLEGAFNIFAFEKTLEHQRQTTKMGTSSSVSLLSMAEFMQQQNATFKLHDRTVEDIRRFWSMMVTKNFEIQVLLLSVQKISIDYRLAMSSYETLIAKAPKSITLLERYGAFIRDVTFDDISYLALQRVIEGIKDDALGGGAEENENEKRSQYSGKMSAVIKTSISSSSTGALDFDFNFNAINNSKLRIKRMKLTKAYVYKTSAFVLTKKNIMIGAILLLAAMVIGACVLHFSDADNWLKSVQVTKIATDVRTASNRLMSLSRDLSLASGPRGQGDDNALKKVRALLKLNVDTLFNRFDYRAVQSLYLFVNLALSSPQPFDPPSISPGPPC
jgi:hypothetical protein